MLVSHTTAMMATARCVVMMQWYRRRVKDGDIAVRRNSAQERQRGNDRTAYHNVDHIV